MAKENKNNNKDYDKNVEEHHHKNTASKYTVEEIAHMGGEAGGNAPHVCRGLQCLKEEEEGKRVKGQEKK